MGKIGESAICVLWLEGEGLNEAIRKVDTLCELFCCGSTDTAASARDDRDTTLVQDWVSILV